MPEIAFVEIDGVEEEDYFSNVKGQEGKLLVLQFDHDVSKEVDPLDCCKVRSDRHHGQASILTYQGKSTPELNKLLCEGGTVPQIQIKWYRQPDGSSGDPEHYFTHTFKDCIVTAVRPAMSNALSGGDSGHMLTFTFGYKQLTWTSETGGTEFSDEVRQ